MKFKQISEKLTDDEKEKYHLAFINSEGAVVYISDILKDDDSKTLLFTEDNRKISIENTINFLNKISRRKILIKREFLNEIKAIVRVILNEMEKQTISYDEIYDRLLGIEKALEKN